MSDPILKLHYDNQNQFNQDLDNFANEVKYLGRFKYLCATDQGISEIGIWKKMQEFLGGWFGKEDKTSKNSIDKVLGQVIVNNEKFITTPEQKENIYKIALSINLIKKNNTKTTSKGEKARAVAKDVSEVAVLLACLYLFPNPLKIDGKKIVAVSTKQHEISQGSNTISQKSLKERNHEIASEFNGDLIIENSQIDLIETEPLTHPDNKAMQGTESKSQLSNTVSLPVNERNIFDEEFSKALKKDTEANYSQKESAKTTIEPQPELEERMQPEEAGLIENDQINEIELPLEKKSPITLKGKETEKTDKAISLMVDNYSGTWVDTLKKVIMISPIVMIGGLIGAKFLPDEQAVENAVGESMERFLEIKDAALPFITGEAPETSNLPFSKVHEFTSMDNFYVTHSYRGLSGGLFEEIGRSNPNIISTLDGKPVEVPGDLYFKNKKWELISGEQVVTSPTKVLIALLKKELQGGSLEEIDDKLSEILKDGADINDEIVNLARELFLKGKGEKVTIEIMNRSKKATSDTVHNQEFQVLSALLSLSFDGKVQMSTDAKIFALKEKLQRVDLEIGIFDDTLSEILKDSADINDEIVNLARELFLKGKGEKVTIEIMNRLKKVTSDTFENKEFQVLSVLLGLSADNEVQMDTNDFMKQLMFKVVQSTPVKIATPFKKFLEDILVKIAPFSNEATLIRSYYKNPSYKFKFNKYTGKIEVNGDA
jgi:hypothetical protein